MKKSKTVSLLLAFFFGWFGGHKFYLGQTVTGLLYLLFFWTFIPSFLSLYFIVTHAFLTETEFAQKYEVGSHPISKKKDNVVKNNVVLEKPKDLRGFLEAMKTTWDDPATRREILKKVFSETIKKILGS